VSKNARNHTLLYFGPFDPNFRTLTATTTTYDETVDAEARPGRKRRGPVDVDAATEKVKKWNGLQFRYMRLSRSPEQNFVVGVERIVLRVPIVLVYERHMDGKRFVANSPAYLSDDSALRLLVDLAVANPEYRDDLGRLVRSLGSSP
jgi:hypothetical protein